MPPITLILSLLRPLTDLKGRLIEFAVCAAILGIGCFYLLSQPDMESHPGLFALFPVLIFVALRQGLRLTCLSLVLLSVTALATTWYYSPFNVSPYNPFFLPWFLLAAIVSTLLTSIASRGKRRCLQLLAEAEAQYEKLVNGAPVLINGFTNEGKCTVWNDECGKVYGWSRKEIMEHPDPLSVLYPDPTQRAAALDHIRGQSEGTFKEWHPINRQGATLTVLWGNVHITSNHSIGIGVNLSSRVRAEKELRLIKERYDHLVQRIPVGVFTLRRTADGMISYDYVSPRLCEIYGLQAAEIYSCPKRVSDRWHPDDQAEIARVAEETRAWLRPMRVDTRIMFNGEERWIRIEANPIRLPNGDTLYDGVQTDISEIKGNEFELALAASVFKLSYDSILILDEQHMIVDANPSVARLSGHSREELLGTSVDRLIPEGETDLTCQQAIWHTVDTTGAWQGEVNMLARNQTVRPLQLSIVPVRNSKDVILRYIVVGTDVSLLKAREARLEKLAHFDPLTQLPNRYLLADRLRQAISKADRNRNLLAVCYIDLDGFKDVNDKHGHDIGDLVLKNVSMRLMDATRKTDTIARLGGDELILLLGDLDEANECKEMLERVLQLISIPTEISEQHRIHISASIGVSFYPTDSHLPEVLVQQADRAMYVAKHSGKNNFHMYSEHSR